MKSTRTMDTARHFRFLLVALPLLLAGGALGPNACALIEGSGIVTSVRGAPVVPDGTVAGAQTDFVITLDTSLDPAVPGRELPALHTIKVTLPEGFVNTGALPLRDPTSCDRAEPLAWMCAVAFAVVGVVQRVDPAREEAEQS